MVSSGWVGADVGGKLLDIELVLVFLVVVWVKMVCGAFRGDGCGGPPPPPLGRGLGWLDVGRGLFFF